MGLRHSHVGTAIKATVCPVEQVRPLVGRAVKWGGVRYGQGGDAGLLRQNRLIRAVLLNDTETSQDSNRCRVERRGRQPHTGFRAPPRCATRCNGARAAVPAARWSQAMAVELHRLRVAAGYADSYAAHCEQYSLPYFQQAADCSQRRGRRPQPLACVCAATACPAPPVALLRVAGTGGRRGVVGSCVSAQQGLQGLQ